VLCDRDDDERHHAIDRQRLRELHGKRRERGGVVREAAIAVWGREGIAIARRPALARAMDRAVGVDVRDLAVADGEHDATVGVRVRAEAIVQRDVQVRQQLDAAQPQQTGHEG
jgi:hypothetical protein